MDPSFSSFVVWTYPGVDAEARKLQTGPWEGGSGESERKGKERGSCWGQKGSRTEVGRGGKRDGGKRLHQNEGGLKSLYGA